MQTGAFGSSRETIADVGGGVSQNGKVVPQKTTDASTGHRIPTTRIILRDK